MKSLSKLFLYALAITVFLFNQQIVSAQTAAQSLEDKIKQTKEAIEQIKQKAASSPSLTASLAPILNKRQAMLNDLEALRSLTGTLTAKEVGDVMASLDNNTTGAVVAAPPPSPAKLAEKPPKINDQSITDQSTRITGRNAVPDATVEVFVNNDSAGTVTASSEGTYSKNVPALSAGDLIKVRQTSDGVTSGFSKDQEVRGLDPNHGTPVGYLIGGVVLSQQAKQFSQSDPFFGFIGGYRFGRFAKKNTDGIRLDAYDNKVDEEGYLVEECTQSGIGDPYCKRLSNKDSKYYRRVERAGEYVRSEKLAYKKGPLTIGQWNLRFQGIFQSDPRTATDEQANMGPNFEPFIASLKSFNVETQLWYDLQIASKVRMGPYAAWGGSTVLSRSELNGEAISQNSGSTINGASAKIDEDIKQYKEYGMHVNVSLFNGNLYLQSILAKGHYEALKGLAPNHDTQNRFIGKLRIIPEGLSYSFGAQRNFTPIFGVDINAGYGQDQVKFFFGSIIRIKGLMP